MTQQEKADKIIRLAKEHKILSFDMEFKVQRSDGLEWHYTDTGFKVHGVAFAGVDNGEEWGCYLTDYEQIQRIVDECFYDESIECWGHYTKIDYICIKQSGITLPFNFNIRCTAMALNLIDEDRMKYGLKVITPEFLGYNLTEFDKNLDLDSPEFHKYAMEDAVATLRLALLFKKRIKELDLQGVFDLISPTLLVFADMELAGIRWDPEYSLKFLDEFLEIRDDLEAELAAELGGNLNLGSPKQLAFKLFNEKLYSKKGLDMTAGGQISTNDVNIEKLAERYPVCELIMAHRTCNKMLSSYVHTFNNHIHRYEDGRAHGRFGYTLKTGRTSCVDPPLQTVPSKPLGRKLKFNDDFKERLNKIKLREGIRPEKGRAFVCRDYSSLEYRTAAVAAPEPRLIEMYCKWECENCGDSGSTSAVVNDCPSCGKPVDQGEDLHEKNKNIANLNGADVTRSDAKELSFLSIFAGSAWKLSKSWNLDMQTAERILNSVFDEFKGFKKWHQRTEKIRDQNNVLDGHNRKMTQGEVRDIFGRRRKISLNKVLKGVKIRGREERWDDKTLQRKIRGAKKNILNMLVNFVAQAPACIIGQLAMQEFRKEMIRRGWWGTRVSIVNFVHDEILVECDDELAEEVNLLLKKYMENTVDIGVPLHTEGGIARHGQSWADLK